MTPPDEPIAVLVVDDHHVFAEAIATALSLAPDIHVVDTVGTVAEGIAAIGRRPPDVALLDYELPDGLGTEICARARADHPDCRVVMLSQFEDPRVVVEAIEAGAAAFLPKTSSLTEVADAVRAAHDGETLLPASAIQSLVSELRRASAPAATNDRPDLTPREREILRLIAQGQTNAAIAEQLVVSPHTVRTHVQNLLRKLDVHSKLAAVAAALRLGLLPETDR